MDLPPQETQNLLRLLALKRHESPPPGFFDRLPNRILVNIRAGSEITEAPWWNRLWDSLVREPMVASSYAALAMGGLLFGVSVYQTAVESDPHPIDFALRENPIQDLRFGSGSLPNSQRYAPSAASLPPFAFRRTADGTTSLTSDPDPRVRAGTFRLVPVRMEGAGREDWSSGVPRHDSLLGQLER